MLFESVKIPLVIFAGKGPVGVTAQLAIKKDSKTMADVWKKLDLFMVLNR